MWKTIEGYPNYAVSNDGSIINIHRNETMYIRVKKIKQAILNKAHEKHIPCTQGDFDSVDMIEDVFDQLATKQAESYGAKMTDLQSQVGKGDEEKIKGYTEQISKYEQSLKDERDAKKTIAKQFDDYRNEQDGKVKSIHLGSYKEKLLSSIGYDPNQMKDPLKAEGWNAFVDKNYKFDYDEHGKPAMFNMDGSRIKNPKKADEWMPDKDVLSARAEEFNLLPKNQQAGQPAFRPPVPPPTGSQPPPFQPPAPGTPPPTHRNKLAPGMEQYTTK